MYHLTKVSSNSKVGPIPVSTSAESTCPPACPLREGCYAKGGPLYIHWKKVSNGSRGVPFSEFCKEIKGLPKNQLWRHNQAGDLPGEGDKINNGQVYSLVQANKGKRGFTYTHKPVKDSPYAEENVEVIKFCNDNGFTVNLSANNLDEVDEYMALDIGPVVTVLPENSPKNFTTKGGNKVVVCPAQLNDKTSCNTCQLCQKKDRDYAIGFRSHGNRKRKVEEVYESTRGVPG